MFTGKKILITAGPTREYLDPVRYITNESTGKMGYAIAESLFQNGANVYLISGIVSLQHSLPKANITIVKTAEEMYLASSQHFSDCDIAIFAAAVSDYKPKVQSVEKIKKQDKFISIEFEKTKDIAFEFGKMKKERQISIGFALETQNIIDNAAKKLNAKNYDFIVINSPNINEGFGYDTNKISILNKQGELNLFELKSKKEVAKDIENQILNILK